MTALLDERDRQYETTEETDVTVVETEETITEETDATMVETWKRRKRTRRKRTRRTRRKRT